jgi:predicted RNase H-like nuclease (RuvC/YqgF family)
MELLPLSDFINTLKSEDLLRMEISTQDIIKIFGYACGVIGSMIAAGSAIFALLRKSEIKARDNQHLELVKKMETHAISTTKGLDEIKADLKPLTLTVERHGEKINALGARVEEVEKWTGHLDTRVQRIEREARGVKQ